MFISKIEPAITVPVSEGTVFTISAPAGVERRVVIENLDSSNTLTWRFQYSDDNSNFTDVSSDATLAPGDRTSAILQGNIFHRFRASGNLNIAVKVDAELDIVANTFSYFST